LNEAPAFTAVALYRLLQTERTGILDRARDPDEIGSPMLDVAGGLAGARAIARDLTGRLKELWDRCKDKAERPLNLQLPGR
jgi:hypothetical protein